ncbi:MAG: hypothetical protein OES38_06170 [Gammaproteobacteria bacterium]|nr:hypothetical protein [Gammaproteobacteria bacterium]
MTTLRMFLLLCLAVVPFKAIAEEAPPIFIGASNFILTGNANAQNRFEAVVKKAVEAHTQLDTKRYWTAFQQQMGNPRHYTLTRIFPNIGAMDEEPRNALVEAFGEEEVAKLFTGDAVVESTERGLWFERRDLSTAPSNAAGELSIWLQVGVKPGEEERFEAYLAKVAEATRQVVPEVSYTTFAPVFGSPDIYVFAVPTSFAQLDAGPGIPVSQRLREAFGEREAKKLEAERAASVASSATLLIRTRTDMSYLPPAE